MVEGLQKIIENKKLTNEQWQEIVYELIKLVPEDRYSRINYLINKDVIKENLSLDNIIEIITNIEEAAREGIYCDSSYFDYRLGIEVVEGDTSWIDEIDKAFRGIKGLFSQKKYEEVIAAYEYAFNFMDGDEELYSLLPEYYDREEKIESKLQEHYFYYLEAIYYSKTVNKIEKFVDAFRKHKYNYENDNIIHKFCQKYDDFINDMIEPIIKKLAQENHMFLEKIMFQLLLEKNGIQSIMQFLKENIKENIRIFKLFCEFMLEKEKYEELLENLYILEDLEMHSSQKELIYKQIIKVANIMKNEKTKEKYLYKINVLNPSLKYTLEICKKLSKNDKIGQIEKLNEKLIINQENQDEKILVELMLGKIENVYELYKKMRTYQRERIENIVIYYLLKFGSKEIKEKKLLTSELISEINMVDSSLDTEQILEIMTITKNNNLKNEFREQIEKTFMKKIAKKTKEILQAQERGNYPKVATYLVILVEHFYKEGRENDAKILLLKYQEEYRKFNLYRKCIQEELNKSSINW